MTDLERAARAYVAARVRLAEADSASLLLRAVECDETFHALHTACGIPFPDCCGEDDCLTLAQALEEKTR
jgi:hypothetical protein